MSRHTLTQWPATEDIGQMEITIGWDRPLDTYFVQCFNQAIDEDARGYQLLWIGCTPGEIRDVDHAITKAAEWGQVTEGLRDQLVKDRELGI